MAKDLFCEENAFSSAVLVPIDVTIFVGLDRADNVVERAVNGFYSEHKVLIRAVNAFCIDRCMCLC